MQVKTKILSSYIIFAPFLIFYIIVIILLHKDLMEGDEGRYYKFAQNLLNGYYSPPGPDIDLWNGPGYPLFLTPFLYLSCPMIYITLANAILQYFSVIFIHKSIMVSGNKKIALYIAVFWGCYFNVFKEMSLILTESLSIFLISLLTYRIISYDNGKIKNILISGLVLGYLVLTKIIFGYVIIILLIIFLLKFYSKNKIFIKNFIFICTSALLFNSPYLFYTYKISNKIFYWGNSGGMSLYWMSSPYENEYGDWKNWNLTLDYPEGSFFSFKADSVLKENHKKDYKRIFQYTGVKRDDEFKKVALENIKAYPKKYLLNCFFNVERLLFDTPYSYVFQSPNTGVKAIFPSIIFTFIFICSILSILYFKYFKPSITFLLYLIITYMCLTITVSAYARQFYIIVPVILVWIGYVLSITLCKFNSKNFNHLISESIN